MDQRNQEAKEEHEHLHDLVLAAVMDEVEQFTPQDFASFEEARELLKVAAFTAESLFTKDRDALALVYMRETRQAFCEYIENLTEAELASIEPLPYRRVLTQKEIDAIWKALGRTWGIREGKYYWYPLEASKYDNVAAFKVSDFIDAPIFPRLQQFLLDNGIKRIFELPEIGCVKEIDVEGEEILFYHTSEIFWTSSEMDWVIYISHENSIAIGGWLLERVKQELVDWDALLYPSPKADR
ncbi:MAG: hypothetical protein H0T73_02030 [Ardenticatenales bacterium]|nr:hypothetical protein [Ardenticatenales bacterium]